MSHEMPFMESVGVIKADCAPVVSPAQPVMNKSQVISHHIFLVVEVNFDTD